MPNRTIGNKPIVRALVASSLAGVFLIAACNLIKKPNYADSKAAVSSSLTKQILAVSGFRSTEIKA